MKLEGILKSLMRSAVLIIFMVSGAAPALAHCDTMNGPVVKAARAALQTHNLNLILIWVRQENENEVRQAFQQTLAVRKLNSTARALADKYFFETVVRIHRAGEGEPYTGLKPESAQVDPVFALVDKALETGTVDPLLKLFPDGSRAEIQNRFRDTLAKKNFDRNDVDAGRHYVAAYVSFLHLLEHLHDEKS